MKTITIAKADFESAAAIAGATKGLYTPPPPLTKLPLPEGLTKSGTIPVPGGVRELYVFSPVIVSIEEYGDVILDSATCRVGSTPTRLEIRVSQVKTGANAGKAAISANLA